MSVAALIVAGGRGTRMGGGLPKQYLDLGGHAVLWHTVARFLAHRGIGTVQVVIGAQDRALYAAAMADVDDARLRAPVTGGATRAATVARGLAALAADAPARVLIHDAARPLIDRDVIDRVLAALDAAPGAFAALPVVDALWRTRAGAAEAPVPRDGLWRAQTPQGFDFAAIHAAHAMADAEAADDVAVAHAAGLRVVAVPGSERNFKITHADDLDRARRLVAQAT